MKATRSQSRSLAPRPKLGRRLLVRAAGVAIAVGFLPSFARRADAASSFRVVVNKKNPASSVTRAFLENAFLKKTTRWDDDEPILPADQAPAAAVRGDFSTEMLKRSVAAVRSYWQQRIFSGRDTPPPELDHDDDVIAYVTKHRGAIGYVSATAKIGDAKVIEVR